MLNHWIARTEPAFAEWEILLPLPTNSAELDSLLHLADEILAAGERESVYRIVETGAPLNYRSHMGWTYADYLRKTLSETGTLPLFNLGSGVAPTSSGQLRTPARLCYYNSTGHLTETEVEDMGLLLEHLRPDDIDWGRGYMERVAPLTLLNQKFSLQKNDLQKALTPPKPFRITISLLTDIWFPQVLGLLEDDQPPVTYPRNWYSNEQLASCHTPRLNRFISTVQTSCLEIGGLWSVVPPEGSAKHYASMVKEDGIAIN
jgi:hypothetical protein